MRSANPHVSLFPKLPFFGPLRLPTWCHFKLLNRPLQAELLIRMYEQNVTVQFLLLAPSRNCSPLWNALQQVRCGHNSFTTIPTWSSISFPTALNLGWLGDLLWPKGCGSSDILWFQSLGFQMPWSFHFRPHWTLLPYEQTHLWGWEITQPSY